MQNVEGYAIPDNIFNILTPKRTKSSPQEREVFTPEDLGKLFRNEGFRVLERERPERYWVPLLAPSIRERGLKKYASLKYGMSVRQGMSGASISMTGGDKVVKTGAGKRLIPLHPQLIAFGFLEYREDMKRGGEKRLFPNLKKTCSTNYLHHLAKCLPDTERCLMGIEKGEKKAFHSFWHTFLLACKESGMPHEMAA